jgi:hypothetical protein
VLTNTNTEEKKHNNEVHKMKFPKLKTVALICVWIIAGFLTFANLRWPEMKVHAQAPAPSMLVSNLAVKTVVSGLNQPTTMAFLPDNRFFVRRRLPARSSS